MDSFEDQMQKKSDIHLHFDSSLFEFLSDLKDCFIKSYTDNYCIQNYLAACEQDKLCAHICDEMASVS